MHYLELEIEHMNFTKSPWRTNKGLNLVALIRHQSCHRIETIKLIYSTNQLTGFKSLFISAHRSKQTSTLIIQRINKEYMEYLYKQSNLPKIIYIGNFINYDTNSNSSRYFSWKSTGQFFEKVWPHYKLEIYWKYLSK